MKKVGFDLIPEDHPIVPIMLYDGKKAIQMANRLLTKGIYVVAFSYPVFPKLKARIRTQIFAAHTVQQIDKTVNAFTEVGNYMNII